MVYQLKVYRSVSELLGSVSIEIEQTRRQMQEVREASGEIRKRSERTRRLQQAFLNGSKPPAPVASQGIKIGELDVVVNAGSDDQILALDLMINAQNERIAALQKIQDSLTRLESKSDPDLLNKISCLVIENDGVPRKLMFQDKSHYESEAMSSLFPATIHGLNPTAQGPHPEQTKLGEVQLEMASIASESAAPHHPNHPHDENPEHDDPHTPQETDTHHPSSNRRLGNVLRFVTAQPIHN